MRVDLGCGSHKVKGAIGVDIDKNSDADIIYDLNKKYYPFSDDSVDEVYAIEVIEHLKNPKILIEESYRILKKGGKFYLTTPNKDSLINRIFRSYEIPTHVSLFNKNKLENLLKKGGFKIIKIECRSYDLRWKFKFRRFRRFISLFLPERLRENIRVVCVK